MLIAAALILLYGVGLIVLGIWFIRSGRLPGWMKGIWKWPLGNTITHHIVVLQGWAGVLLGGAMLLSGLSFALLGGGAAAKVTGLMVLGAACSLWVFGMVAFAYSTFLSYRPAHPATHNPLAGGAQP